MNVVFIYTDDFNTDLLPYMPITQRLLVDKGVTMTNFYDNVGLCCPARVTTLTSKLSHNTKITSNGGPDGGHSAFHRRGEKSTIATWAQKAGVTTGLFGKYMNEYPHGPEAPDKGVPPTYVPPGWTGWAVPVGGSPYTQWNYKLNINGVVDAKPRDKTDIRNYMTRTIGRLGTRFVAANAGKQKFVEFATYAPHAPYHANPSDIGTFEGLKVPKHESFKEPDLSDKPSFLRGGSLNPNRGPDYFDKVFQRRVESVQSIDRLVGRVVRTLRRAHELKNTYIVFSSDNGQVNGEHQLARGKDNPYQEVVHLPLIIRGPDIAPGTTNDSMVSNVDLAKTFARMLGIRAPKNLDGMSILRMLQGKVQRQRKYVLLERGRSQVGAPTDRTVLEPADSPATVGKTLTVPYKGVVTERYKLIRYSNKAHDYEFYDLWNDPYEVQNFLPNGPDSLDQLDPKKRALFAEMSKAIDVLQDCKGADCIL